MSDYPRTLGRQNAPRLCEALPAVGVGGENFRFQLVDSKRRASNDPKPSKDYPRREARKDRRDDDYHAVPLMF